MDATNVVAMKWGPAFIGWTISLCLYGVTLGQTISYFGEFLSDTRALKVMVAALCLVDTVHVIFLCAAFWHITIAGRNLGPAIVHRNTWEILVSMFVSTILTFMVQMYFCHRVWRLSHRNWFLTNLILVTALTQLVAGFSFVIDGLLNTDPRAVFRGVSYWESNPRLSYSDLADLLPLQSMVIDMGSCLLCDITISASLIYYFKRSLDALDPLPNLPSRMVTVLQKLILVSINQGVLLCLITLATLIMFEAGSGTFIALLSQIISSKLYVNSCLATLNARRGYREITDADFLSLPMSSMNSQPARSRYDAENDEGSILRTKHDH